MNPTTRRALEEALADEERKIARLHAMKEGALARITEIDKKLIELEQNRTELQKTLEES